LVFGAILRETQNVYNELANSSVAWTVQDVPVLITGGQTDYQVSEAGGIGKVLFVTTDVSGYPVGVEFTDLADVSRNWWESMPVAGGPGDYLASTPQMRIAFYRRNGLLYVRVPENFLPSTLTITTATGNWTDNVAVTTQPVLTEYQHLPLLRAAANVLPGARWSENEARDDRRSDQLAMTLREQSARVYEQFVQAKRSLTADDLVLIETNDEYF